MTREDILLLVEGVTLRFGHNAVLSDVTFDVHQGEILAIIGPNGAGKTSMLNCINGFYRPDRGRILFEGQSLLHTPTHQVARLGIARTFQNIALYTGLSTLDNLMAARHVHMQQSSLASMFYWGQALDEEVAHRRIVEEIIDFLEIASIRKAVVGALLQRLGLRAAGQGQPPDSIGTLLLREPIDVVAAFMEPVVAPFMHYKAGNQQRTR